jgi:hypothetical protein
MFFCYRFHAKKLNIQLFSHFTPFNDLSQNNYLAGENEMIIQPISIY